MVAAGALVGARAGRALDRGGSERTLALCGAAGALTAFVEMPVAGAVFAAELLGPGAGLDEPGLGPALLASVAASLAYAREGGGARRSARS